MKQSIPITVLTGYLGSGKTTLFNHILHGDHGLKIAVIVNDMGSVNVDEALINQGGFKRTEEKLISMANGCICCTLREDLIVALDSLAQLPDIDYIVIEASGISEPIPIAQSLTLPENPLGIDLTGQIHLDTMVTVVDAKRIWDDFGSGQPIVDRQKEIVDEENRDIRDLLIDQIEFCNVLILNKCDLLEDWQVEKIETLVHSLQREAKIIRSVRSEITLNDILNTNLFDLEEMSYAAGWIKELELGYQDHVPETEEYGISSFVYRSNLPMDAERFNTFLEKHFPASVVRSKGFVWFAQHSDFSSLMETAGNHVDISPLTYWLATLPKAERMQVLSEDPEIKERWHPVYGDRLTEIVFIGIDMHQSGIEAALDLCLVDEAALQSGLYSKTSPYPWEASSL